MVPGKLYHLYTHANGFENFFKSEDNYRYFLSRYEYFIPPVADTLAYCLMPNHFHFLVRIKEEAELVEFYLKRKKVSPTITLEGLGGAVLEKFIVQQFSHLFNSYTQAYNKMYKRRGSLFIHSYKRKEIDSDLYFTRIIYYIHNNPVHHGFVSQPSAWKWSSYHDFLHDSPSLINKEEIITWFGDKAAFLDFHRQIVHGSLPDYFE